MKIKLPANLAGSEGHIGPIWFDEDGISEPVSAEAARRFLAVFGGEMVEELPEGIATLDQLVVYERRDAELDLAREEQERMQFRKDLPVQEIIEKQKPSRKGGYTFENLSELADKGGIKPLREIGEKFGVKGKAISELIREILEAQEKAEKAPE